MRAVGVTITQLLRLAVRLDRGRLVRACLLLVLGYGSTPFAALGLRWFVDAALARHAGAAVAAALVVGALLACELMAAHFAHLYYFEVGELAEVALNDELLARVHGEPGLEQLDDPEFADGVTLVQEGLARTRPALEAVLQLAGMSEQMLVTAVLLALLSPWLLLLPAVAVVPVLLGRRAQEHVDAAKERCAPQTRRVRHLLDLSTQPASVKEIRLFGAEEELLGRQGEAWRDATRALWAGYRSAAVLRGIGQLVFVLAYGAAVALVMVQVADGRAGLGDLILVITLAVQVSIQVASALNLLTMLQGVSTTMTRLAAMRRATGRAGVPAVAHQRSPIPEPPARSLATRPALIDGIRLEHVGFTYPGTDRPVLRDVDLYLPAGSTIALVGENGAGKSTLVKLLCGLYQPTHGSIMVDGVDLSTGPVQEWHSRVAPLFQDFARVELAAREAVGIGDWPRIQDDAALAEAIDRAAARGALGKVRAGLDGLLGTGYGDGTELSGGEWQRLALARTLMRTRPLLLVLDEPAAALDASAEHALLERFRSASARGSAAGAVTLFVSHRFSTVRNADLIVVLRDGRIIESGDHKALMREDGLYAELYGMQMRVNS
jgi:ATP-binding cassette subfamily B protein